MPQSELINQLTYSMTAYYEGDAKRIQHFIKVHAFSKLIAEGENLNERTKFVLEAASLVHDIGIKKAEELDGTSDGKLQEKYGPEEAEKMLSALGFDEECIKRVSFLVGHHHTYSNIDLDDYRILVEADFLVNIYEDNVDLQGAKSAYDKIFKTQTGRSLCRTMYRV